MPLTTGRATDFITFSRASGATVVDANGKIDWAGHNLVLNSGAPATQTITVEVGRVYTVECTGSGSVTLSGAGTGTVTNGSPVTVTASTTSLVLTVSGSVTTMWAYRSGLGGMQLNPATGTTYYPTTGSIYNAPRLDYDPVTLAARGLLVEEQRSNLLLRSAEFDSASWGKSNVSVTANTSVSPSGSSDADTVTGNTAGTVNYIVQSIVATATVYTYSIWVMAGTATTFTLLLRDDTAASNLTVTASILSGPGSLSGTTAVAVSGLSTTQWTRVALTTTAAATAGNAIQVFFYPEVASGASTTAKSNIVWGAQLEAGSFATSYIPTTTASATRSADVASVATSSFPYDATKGSFIASFSLMGYNPNYRVVENGTNNRWMYGPTSVTTFATYNGTAVVGNTIASPIGRIAKAATAHDSAGQTLVADGTVIASTTDTFGAGSSTMFLGCSSLGFASLSGWLRQITYIPRRLTNAELVTRST